MKKLFKKSFKFQTNIPFIENVLQDSDFVSGFVDTSFIETKPHLLQFKEPKNRAQKLLNYIGDVVVNGPLTPLATTLKPAKIKVGIPSIPVPETIINNELACSSFDNIDSTSSKQYASMFPPGWKQVKFLINT